MRRIAAFAGAVTLVAATIAGGVWAQDDHHEHHRIDPKMQEAMHLAMDADKILRNLPRDRDGRVEHARAGLHDAIHEMEAFLKDSR